MLITCYFYDVMKYVLTPPPCNFPTIRDCHHSDYMDYLINYPRKRKERNIIPSLFVLIEFTDPPSCCFHLVFITAAQMVAVAILRHDGWHSGWSLPFYTFPYCFPVFNWLLNVTIPRSQSWFPGVLLTPPPPLSKKRNLKNG